MIDSDVANYNKYMKSIFYLFHKTIVNEHEMLEMKTFKNIYLIKQLDFPAIYKIPLFSRYQNSINEIATFVTWIFVSFDALSF